MRLAIVTVYDSIVNYGSYLQAYALNKVLINMGHEVYFIERMEEKEILNRFDNLCVIQNQIPKNRNLRKLRQISRKIKIKREQLANIHRFNQFKNDWKEFKIINISEIKNYKIDALICGSDEIWNINNKDIDFNFYSCEWEHSLPKLAYAISSGTTKKEELLQLKGSIDAIGDFDIILPRDNATQQLVLKITGQNCNEVCDPTILLGRDNYPQINCEKNYGNYLLVYSYYIRKKERAFILKYAKEHKLKIISPCIYFEDADENIFVPSLEFPTLIKNANCVFTTTFHGTIFSLMFAKRLCCLSRLPKISDLIEKCNAKNTILPENASYEQFCEIMSNDLDHIEIESKMSEMKQLSKSCLLDGLNQLENKKHKPIGTLKQTYPKIYYGKTCNNDVLKKSSSGGLFYELAQSVLKDGGVVFGAVYNAQKHLVYHESTEKVALNDLMRSKYVESQIGNTYQQIIDFLKEGRKVLFCGTPCQAAGLRKIIDLSFKKLEDNLLIVDFLCEGVPSKKIFSAYQKELETRYNSNLKNVIFRSKEYGWNQHCMKAYFENGKEYLSPSFTDSYMHTFISDLLLNRHCCYDCCFREEKKSDITIGDFWKIKSVDQAFFDNKGVSAIFVNTQKGEATLKSISEKCEIKHLDSTQEVYIHQHIDGKSYYERRNQFYSVFLKSGYSTAINKFSTYMKNSKLRKKYNYFKIYSKFELKRRLKKY